MADGRIIIDVDVNDREVDGVNQRLREVEGSGGKASAGIGKLVSAMGLVKVASAAFDVMKKSMDSAISRFDTMQKYPKVMGALGFSSEESSESVKKLSDGIDGLPTKLDEVVSTSQRMTAITGNMNKSTNATIGLNNAMLASGASSADASRGLDQYVQMLSTGTVDLQSWKTLQETMPIGLQKTAEAMGFVGQSAQRDLYAALKEGNVTFDQFQNQIIELGTGTGELAELARVNSEGIATSFGNLSNTTSKGLANIIEAMNDLSIEVTGKSIAKNLDGVKVAINASFTAMTSVIRASGPVVKTFVTILGGVISVAKPLTPVILGLAAAYGALSIINTVNTFINKHKALIIAATASEKGLTLATSAQVAAQTTSTTATQADILAKGAQNGLIKIGTLLIGLFTGTISLATAATVISTAATTAFTAAITFLTGPIGIAVAAIGLLVAAGIGLWKWFNKESEAAKKLNAEQEELVSSTNSLTDSTKQEANNRKDTVSQIQNSTKAYGDLATKVGDLASKEKKSATEKNLLKSSVEQLNNSIVGLNLVYDAETDKLSMSAEMIKARIAAYQGQETVNESQQSLVTILEEQHAVEEKLKETTALREEWNNKLADGAVKGKEAKEATAELDEQEKTLKATQVELQAEYKNTEATLTTSMAAVTEATQNGVFNQITTYETLTEAQKTAVDEMKAKWQEYQASATEMFDVLSDKQTISVEEMTANLAENQRVIGEWATNIATLSERGINEGLLNKLRDAGPEGAGHVAALVGASDEQLQRLNEVFSNGGTTATTALNTAFDTGSQGVNESVSNMMTGAEATLKEKLSVADFGSIGKSVTDDVAGNITTGSEGVKLASGQMAEGISNSFKEKLPDFKSLGEYIPQGAASGISNGSQEATNASGKLADDISTKFTSALKIQSPSKVFEEHGKFLTEGLANGLNNGTNIVTTALNVLINGINTGMMSMLNSTKSVAMQIPSAFASLPNQMSTIGMQIMYGLASGINSGAGSALRAAEGVASQIKSTMKSALDIHSPSRWMRDEIGRYIPQGIAKGIEVDSSKAYDAMDSMTHKLMIPKLTPEATLNIGARVAGNSSSYNNTSNSNSKTINNTFSGMMEGATFVVREEADINKIASQLQQVVAHAQTKQGMRPRIV